MDVRRVVVGSDHAGFMLKESVKKHLVSKGIEVIDVGTDSEESVNYPPIIRSACDVVLKEGIPGFVFGGSGNGEAMAANKMKGIRAALCYSEETAMLARSHNDANVMSVGGRLTNPDLANRMVDLFLDTPFEGGRHVARVNDLDTPLT
jgi:ribose 5-phosphate isomerase B